MKGITKKESNMKLLRIGVIVGAHGVVFGILYLMSGIGSNGDSVAVAGANGIVNWSSDDPNALSPTVSGVGFSPKASDLTGYNAGDGNYARQAALPDLSSKQRFEPRRPSGPERSTSQPQPSRGADRVGGVLQPLGRGPGNGYSPPENIIAPNTSSQIIRYTVRSGDSLWGISNKFGITQKELQSVNPGLTVNIQPGQVLNVPRQSSPVEQSRVSSPGAEKVEGSIYVVKSGDALSRIAANQGVTLNALRAANNLSGDLIRVGQKLVIPDGRSSNSSPIARRKQGLQVVVAPGDTLSSIAIRYNVSAKDLILHNNIQNPSRINPGQTLFIPSGGSSVPPRTPAPTPSRVVQNEPPPTRPRDFIPEDEPLILPDEDDFLLDEDLIEQPVIPIED